MKVVTGAGYGTWELRQKGERPIIKNDTEKVPVSCLTPKYQETISQNPLNDKQSSHSTFNSLNSTSTLHDQCNKLQHEKIGEKYGHMFNAVIYQNHSIFRLPGQGEQTNDKCGQWVHPLSCPDFGSPQTNLAGGVVLHDRFVIQHSCHKPDCPVCYESWASRQATAAADRLFQAVQLYRKQGLKIETSRGYSTIGRIDHIVFSPSQDKAKKLIKTPDGFKTLRSEAIKNMRRAGVIGGAVVFHPFRQNDSREPNFNSDMLEGVWYVSPHFHVVGCGYLQKSNEFYDMTGWTYKKMERRETVKGTIKYTLTHCGIADGFQALTYFGLFSNNKIVIEKIEKVTEPIKCKACGAELHLFKLISGDNDNLEVDWSQDLGIYLHIVIRKTFKLRERLK